MRRTSTAARNTRSQIRASHANVRSAGVAVVSAVGAAAAVRRAAVVCKAAVRERERVETCV